MIVDHPMNLKTCARIAALLAPLALSAQNYDIALVGDVPYGVAAEPKYERVIADINKTGVDLTFHIGDTKSGSTRCDDSHYQKTLGYFSSFETAVIYSVGDNEWTDCMRTNNGAYSPLDRLALVRKTYFSTNQSLGKRPVTLMRQADDPKYAKFVENTMYVKGPIVFAAIHIPGSNNNLEYKNNQGAANTFYDNDAEYTERNAANIAWLKKTFETAKANKSLGIMLLVQANMFEAFMDTTVGNTHSGFNDYLKALRAETTNFTGEVVMVSGDTHFMRVDKPLTDSWPRCVSETGTCVPYEPAIDARGNRILNFTRAEVPGSADVHWMLCHIRPNSRNVFNFEFMIIPEAGTGATGVRAIVNGPGANAAGTFETVTNTLVLDASASSTTNTGGVSYSWTNAPGYATAAILGATTATPTVQLPLRGTYQLVLTVTDRTGATASTPVTIQY